MTAARRAVDPDKVAVQKAAARTALQVAAVSAGLVIGILGLAVVYVVDQSRPTELLERPAPGEQKIYVDAHNLLFALVVIGALAILMVGAASWLISRRSTTPLGRALRLQRAFVADASHELRTPLTVLDTRLQILQRKLERGEPHEATLDALRDDTRSMIDVVTDLLLVAEASVTGLRNDTQHGSDVRPVLLRAASDIGVLAAERDIAVHADAVTEARVGLSESSLRRCLVVLLDNAVAHSPSGGSVAASVATDRGRVVVRVTDSGPGIRGIEPSRVFERFARGSDADRWNRAGFGIGLALVRDLAGGHGGRVSVESTSAGGTTMRLELPVLH